MEHRRIKLASALAAVCVLGVGAVALADNGRRNFKEALTGFEEVPALSTSGAGEFRASINRDGEIDWTLSFSGLESAATQAHIHFESKSNNGPIIVFLCSNLGNGPAGTQACPAEGGTVSGTIRAADVGAGGAAQGLAAGELAEFVNAVRCRSDLRERSQRDSPGRRDPRPVGRRLRVPTVRRAHPGAADGQAFSRISRPLWVLDVGTWVARYTSRTVGVIAPRMISHITSSMPSDPASRMYSRCEILVTASGSATIWSRNW